MKQVLLINLGNTNTQIGVAQLDNSEFVKVVETLPTVSLFNQLERLWELLDSNYEIVVIACVVPELERRLMHEREFTNVFWVSSEMNLNIDFSNIDKRTLGADRIANAVAACELIELPAVILDCGTAITAEVIDKGNRFVGGMIMPGRQMSRNALANKTGQLPQSKGGITIPNQFGKNTLEAIDVGVDLGSVGAIEKVLSLCSDLTTNKKLKVIAIGGDRQFFIKHITEVEPGHDNFTLIGLKFIANHLQRMKNKNIANT